VRRGLEPAMAGRVIVSADVRRPDLRWPLPVNLAGRLTGARVLALRRRSKYLLLDLDAGDTLIVHLGMSGRMLVTGEPQPADPSERHVLGAFVHEHPAPAKHDHVVLDMDSGARISFNDARRFGAIDLWPTEALAEHPRLAGLGPEPLGNGFNPAGLFDGIKGRLAPIKSLLLDQRLVAGLGNIYVCEALWRAGLSPTRPGAEVRPDMAERLVSAIREVLTEAIAAGGSSLRDHRQADGALGYFQHAFAVYGRQGLPCSRVDCGGMIERVVQSGRSSFHCPRCQRP
jgi:formamidopyrimidine-DNA glycosylase